MYRDFMRAVKRVVIGPTLNTSQLAHQKLNKIRALAVFSSDSLSSVAYSTEEILIVLQAVAAAYITDIALALAVLLLILTTSYRQTIHAYPKGGGSYIVAKDNLGTHAGLIAAASLLVDYVLTVAVSVSSGVANIASVYHALRPYHVEISVGAVAFIMLMNLRGIKESGTLFAVPTYAFLASSFFMLGTGLYRYFAGTLTPVPYVVPDYHGAPVADAVTVFLLLRAFSAGCLALTGVEAISDGVPAFKSPEAHNAAVTMLWSAVLLGINIVGNAFLVKHLHILPSHAGTVMSQTSAAVFGQGSVLHVLHQWATMLILVLAANTAFADFPRLASFLSKDRFMPRAMASKGDRLVFHNGIIALAVLSSLLIIVFKGRTSSLAPLYAVGVFISFTLSQSGMVKKWLSQGRGAKALVNGIGAFVTAFVALLLISTKFLHGAWMVILVIPIVVAILLRTYRHYDSLRLRLKVGNHVPIRRSASMSIAVIPIGNTTTVARNALEDLVSFVSRNVIIRAVHVNTHETNDPRRRERAAEFESWVGPINSERISEGYEPITLDIIDSPKRSVLEPLLAYVEGLSKEFPNHEIKIFIPEFIPSSWFARLALHGQMGRLIYGAFRDRGYQVSSIPSHID